MNKLWLVAGSFVGAIFLIWQFTYNNENYYSGFQKNHVYGLHNSIKVSKKTTATLRSNDDE